MTTPTTTTTTAPTTAPETTAPATPTTTTVTLTDLARTKVHAFLAEETDPDSKALRVFVEGGGCAGFQYGLTIDEPREGDQIIAIDGFRVVIDQQSSIYLDGCQVDFVQEGLQAGFKIENPNAKGECGCGHSFSV